MYARLGLSVFGQAIDTWDFDESILEELEAEVTPDETAGKSMGNAGRKVFSLTQDWTFLMPTELGVPLFFDHKQVDFVYSNRQRFDVTHGDNADLKLNIKGHYV